MAKEKKAIIKLTPIEWAYQRRLPTDVFIHYTEAISLEKFEVLAKKHLNQNKYKL